MTDSRAACIQYACCMTQIDMARFLIENGSDKAAAADEPYDWRNFGAV
jgi:hypothetical protein